MSGPASDRLWLRAAIVLQAVGYAVDIAWHGLLRPEEDPATVAKMAHHLATVHLPLYVGAAAVLATSAVMALRRPGTASVIALLGAVVSASAESWHAYSHLQLDTHHAPIAGTLSGVGFLVVLVATWRSGRSRRSAEAERARSGAYPR